jgi:hypothetical protein
MVDLTLRRPVLDWLVWLEIGLAFLALPLYVWSRWQQPQLLRWLWLGGGLAALGYAYLIAMFNLTFFFGLVAIYIIYRFWKKNLDLLDGWLVTILTLLSLISFTGYYLLIWLWETFELWNATALILELNRASRFVYLPLYMLVGRAALCLALELQTWQRVREPAGVAVAISLVLSFGGVWSRHWTNELWLAGLIFIGMGLTIVSLTWLFSGVWYSLLHQLSPWFIGFSLIFIIFGPLGADVSTYLPIPATNLWILDSLRLGPLNNENEAQLYDWVQANTTRDALFYPCISDRFDPMRFRYKARRSITHAWKDLSLGYYNPASLLRMYERYVKLSEACKDPFLAVVAGREVKADFIIGSTGDTLKMFDNYVCFRNDQYTLITLNPTGCSVHLNVSD